jgi:hypothetical protein
VKKSILAVSVFATLAIAAPASADKSDRARDAAAKACHAEKKADSVAFESAYGPKHAMRNCIKGTTPEANKSAAKGAPKDCKAERDADPVAFAENYGTNGNGRNALGKCVSKELEPTPV